MSMRPILFFFILAANLLYAQTGNLRTFYIKPSPNKIKIDSLSIYPNSFFVLNNGDTFSKSDYSLDYASATFQFLTTVKVDSLKLIYRVLPFDLSLKYKSYDSTLLTKIGVDERDKYKIVNSYSVNDVFGGQELSKNGSISRGVSFGNKQDFRDFGLRKNEFALGDLPHSTQNLNSCNDVICFREWKTIWGGSH